jgi:hypothetical protein
MVCESCTRWRTAYVRDAAARGRRCRHRDRPGAPPFGRVLIPESNPMADHPSVSWTAATMQPRLAVCGIPRRGCVRLLLGVHGVAV